MVLSDKMSFFANDEDGISELKENVSLLRIMETDKTKDLLSKIPADETVTITGKMEIVNDDVCVKAEKIEDSSGMLITKDSLKKKANTMSNTSEYILPNSDSILLTSADVSGLSLQQINYAKNEIYARHGRLFDSPELQKYFNSKDWYSGRIDASSFNDSMLSDIEKKNAEFLSSVEFGISADGYQLDQ